MWMMNLLVLLLVQSMSVLGLGWGQDALLVPELPLVEVLFWGRGQ
jgi:hypothetical protein